MTATAMREAARLEKEVERLKDALREIALAGMSGTGQESAEAMQAWHARRAREFIGIAARALSPAISHSQPQEEGKTQGRGAETDGMALPHGGQKNG